MADRINDMRASLVKHLKDLGKCARRGDGLASTAPRDITCCSESTS